MAREQILVVEDEKGIQELVCFNLTKEGYEVTRADCGEDALRAVRDQVPDLILLDLMMPGLDGLEVCRRLRRDVRTQNVPVVILTAKGEEADIVTGLELGADDYVTKPFSPRVLLARVRAVLRRKTREPVDEKSVIRIRELEIDPGRFAVAVSGTPVELTFTEFSVLHAMAKRPGWVFTRQQIAEAVHGDDCMVTDRSVDVQIVSLRKKLGSAGRAIKTVRGVGYKILG